MRCSDAGDRWKDERFDPHGNELVASAVKDYLGLERLSYGLERGVSDTRGENFGNAVIEGLVEYVKSSGYGAYELLSQFAIQWTPERLADSRGLLVEAINSDPDESRREKNIRDLDVDLCKSLFGLFNAIENQGQEMKALFDKLKGQ
jgi:hypothetical protein